jgi:hypothetical protein
MTEDVEVKTDRIYDKEEWGPGVWQEEPDRVAWTDPDTGYPCIVRRGNSGAWCGYVGVGEGHPWFGKSYHSCTIGGCEDDWCEHRVEAMLDVHGGITYAEACQEEDRETGVCHISPNPAWWFGFDCAHAGDYSPKIEAALRKYAAEKPTMSPELTAWKEAHPDHYWTMGQVMMETHHLAQQLAKFSGAPAWQSDDG